MSLNEHEILAAVEEQIRKDHERLSRVNLEPPATKIPNNDDLFLDYSVESRKLFRRGGRELREGNFRAGLYSLWQGLRKFDQAGKYRTGKQY